MTAEEQAIAAWRVVEAEMGDVAPMLVDRLPAGATLQLVKRVEAQLGVRLPDAALAIFLVHDGIGIPAVRDGVAQVSYLLSLDDALDHWRDLTDMLDRGLFAKFGVRQTLGPVRPHWWNRRWLPVSTDGAGNHFCLDLDPPPEGTLGQVIEFRHDDETRGVVAPDLPAYLIGHVDVHEWALTEGLIEG